ncbi:MAG: hypothetical protein KKD86_05690 [Bacteroidetes bacterium]|mgnify:CR=1 FL=1|nr:hypothetical protein [Bacteroidota bacterium]
MEDNLWRQKAVERRAELKELGKRRKELNSSRENWKNKYIAQKQRADLLEKELTSIKKKLSDIMRD